jgi:hypothetical protein
MFKKILGRWLYDLYCIFKKDPISGSVLKDATDTRWNFELEGEFDNYEFLYLTFIILLSFFTAFIRFLVFKHHNLQESLALFLSVPIQAVVSSSLCAVFLWIGAYFNRKPISLIKCAKLSLRVISILPFLQLLYFYSITSGRILGLIFLSFAMIKAAINVLHMPIRNAIAFFGAVYFSLITIELQSRYRQILQVEKNKNQESMFGTPPVVDALIESAKTKNSKE